MYGLEILEGMNNREMNRYHKEQRRKHNAIKLAIIEGINEYLRETPKEDRALTTYKIYDKIDAKINDIDFENQEEL